MPADDHTNAVDGTAAAGVRGPSSCLAHGKCAYSGVFTSTQYGPEAGRLHGADEPDDVQLTLAGQFALRPSMFQEVGIGEGPVVQLHGGGVLHLGERAPQRIRRNSISTSFSPLLRSAARISPGLVPASRVRARSSMCKTDSGEPR